MSNQMIENCLVVYALCIDIVSLDLACVDSFALYIHIVLRWIKRLTFVGIRM